MEGQCNCTPSACWFIRQFYVLTRNWKVVWVHDLIIDNEVVIMKSWYARNITKQNKQTSRNRMNERRQFWWHFNDILNMATLALQNRSSNRLMFFYFWFVFCFCFRFRLQYFILMVTNFLVYHCKRQPRQLVYHV